MGLQCGACAASLVVCVPRVSLSVPDVVGCPAPLPPPEETTEDGWGRGLTWSRPELLPLTTFEATF